MAAEGERSTVNNSVVSITKPTARYILHLPTEPKEDIAAFVFS